MNIEKAGKKYYKQRVHSIQKPD